MQNLTKIRFKIEGAIDFFYQFLSLQKELRIDTRQKNQEEPLTDKAPPPAYNTPRPFENQIRPDYQIIWQSQIIWQMQILRYPCDYTHV